MSIHDTAKAILDRARAAHRSADEQLRHDVRRWATEIPVERVATVGSSVITNLTATRAAYDIAKESGGEWSEWSALDALLDGQVIQTSAARYVAPDAVDA